MKRILLSLVVMCAMLGVAARDNGFYAGVEGTYNVVSGSNAKYGLFGINGSYVFNLPLGFYVSPEASLYYQHHNENTGWIGGAMPSSQKAKYDWHTDIFGGALAFYIGKKIAGPIYIFTAPAVRCNFYQKETCTSGGISSTMPSFGEHRANMLWKFGIECDIWRLRIRASYDQYVTNRMSYSTSKNGDITLAVAYGF